jgi:hypothetical protein
MEWVDYAQPPLITEANVLWRVVCFGPEAEAPKAVAYHRGEERCAQALAYSERSAWPCSACGRPDRDHVRIWTESVPLEEAFRAHRAMQLGQEAQSPTVSPEELEARSPGKERMGGIAPHAEVPVTPAPPLEAPNQPPRSGRQRGPHADRLEKARAAHRAATQPKPKVVTPRDPFDVEDL